MGYCQKTRNLVRLPSGPFLNFKKNNLNFQIRYYSPHIGVTFYKENDMHIITTFGVQILSPSRILLYHRGVSFNITLSKLVNSPFKGVRGVLALGTFLLNIQFFSALPKEGVVFYKSKSVFLREKY